MRQFVSMLAGALLLLAAGVAMARLEPPFKVHIAGSPRAAEPGVPFRGQLKVEAGMSLVIDDLRFEEGKWDQVTLAAPPQLSLAKDASQLLDFTVVTSDPNEPLVLTCVIDGQPVSRAFDLSSAGVAAVREPGNVVQVPDEPRSRPAAPTPAALVQSPDGPALRDAAKGYDIRVHGRFVYTRSDGLTLGGSVMRVEVYDDDSPLPAAHIGDGFTDHDGYFDFNVNWGGDFFDNEPDIFVKVDAWNFRMQVESPSWESSPFSWRTPTRSDFTGIDLDLGTFSPADISMHPAVHLFSTISRAWHVIHEVTEYNILPVHCNWPNGATGMSYDGEIYVGLDQQWNDANLVHQYGHHWVNVFAANGPLDYCNGSCDASPPACGYCDWCSESPYVAFSEGLPQWFADWVPRRFPSYFGLSALTSVQTETVSTCSGTLADALTSAGNFAALVRDVGDAENDDDPGLPLGVDQLTEGEDLMLNIIDNDHPTTPLAFLNLLEARMQHIRETLWNTAKNCNFETDDVPPPAVSGLVSTSHVTTGDSTDPTIDFTWTRPLDDASGVAGYGISVTSAPELPAAVLDLGDVTNYTTPALAAGTWYLSLRSYDHSGKWSATYASIGPFTIRAPTPANLAYYQWPGWSGVVVPRPAADATFGSVPAPSTLAGNAGSTYWNAGLWNSGDAATGSGLYVQSKVDGQGLNSFWVPAIGVHAGNYGANVGPVTVRGGRHTLEARLDATDLVAEANEGDNRWGHQWVWSPLALASGTAVTRAAPPLKTAGWDAVTDGSTLYVNSDGLRMGATGWWDATVLRPTATTQDYDLYLHTASGGPTDGFAAYLCASARGSGGVDAVIVNRNQLGWGSHDVGVINYNSASGNYAATSVASGAWAFGDSATVSFTTDQMLRLWEVSVSASQVGLVSITLVTDTAGVPFHVNWLSHDFQTGGLGTYAGTAYTGADGRGRLDLNVAAAGYYGLVVWRDPDWTAGNGARNVTIEVDRTPCDLEAWHPAGWYAPLVPRLAADGTSTTATAPTTLAGDTAPTYINVSFLNDSPAAAPSGFSGQVSVDGVGFGTQGWGAVAAGYQGTANWQSGPVVRGGRHALSWRLDHANQVKELDETNNLWCEQWVWSPATLTTDLPVTRSMPPEQQAGWADLTSGETFYPNCDGLRMGVSPGYWRAVAVMPGPGSDVDLRLHQPTTGAKSGFTDNLAGSFWWEGHGDYVLVNFNLQASQPYDVGVLRYAGSTSYTAETTSSGAWISNPDGIYGPYSLPAGRQLNLVEVYLPEGHTGVHLIVQSGTVDYGLTMHRADMVCQGKSDYVAMAMDGFGYGQDELIDAPITTAGWYCIAVWKKSPADLARAGTYKLLIRPMWTSGAPDEPLLPAATRLVGASPNPFNPRTQLAFELAAGGDVRLGVYDLQGRLVRVLAAGTWPAGRHNVTWDGLDDAGGQVASGLYMARLEAGGATYLVKMTMLK
jgi:hypothetical protein